MKNYKILSVSSLVPLAVEIKDEQGIEPAKILNVKIDYRSEKVYFENAPEGLDLNALERQIIDYFKPPVVEIPNVYYDYLEKVKEVRSGDYATSFMNEINGDKNDSRQP